MAVDLNTVLSCSATGGFEPVPDTCTWSPVLLMYTLILIILLTWQVPQVDRKYILAQVITWFVTKRPLENWENNLNIVFACTKTKMNICAIWLSQSLPLDYIPALLLNGLPSMNKVILSYLIQLLKIPGLARWNRNSVKVELVELISNYGQYVVGNKHHQYSVWSLIWPVQYMVGNTVSTVCDW